MLNFLDKEGTWLMNISNPAPQSMIADTPARANDDIARVSPGTPGGQFLR